MSAREANSSSSFSFVVFVSFVARHLFIEAFSFHCSKVAKAVRLRFIFKKKKL